MNRTIRVRFRRYGRRVDVQWHPIGERRWRHTQPWYARLLGGF